MVGTFTTNPVALKTLLEGLRDGTIQLPDFQRGWVWDDERIKGVLASVSRSFPVGAVMMLQTGGTTRFKTRPVEGIAASGLKEPTQLILDGQQRLTSMFQATLLGKAVKTTNPRKQPLTVWFYIDMAKALASPDEREEAFLTVPESKQRKNLKGELAFDLSTRELEFEKGLFPCSELFDSAAWRRGFNRYWQQSVEKSDLFDRFEAEIIERFKAYQIPVITLGNDVSKEAVCHVFEKVNTGGVTLTAFELLTATFAADAFELRRDWHGPAGTDDNQTYLGILPRLKASPVLRGTRETDLLQVVALLSTHAAHRAKRDEGLRKDQAPAVSCTRKTVLDLPLGAYLKVREQAVVGFERAARLLVEQNIFNHAYLPYQTQLVPLAAILASLGSRWQDHAVKSKIARWYWCGVLGELYGGAIETRFARDLPEVLDWIDGGLEPSTVSGASFNPGRLQTLRTRGSAAYKGLYALLMGDSAYDWLTGTTLTVNTYAAEKIDIHHVFPKAWCEGKDETGKVRVDPRRMDSIVNKTALSARTNRKIGGRAPSVYLSTIMKEGGPEEVDLDRYLRSHLIDPEHLRTNDFEAFFATRTRELLALIERATGIVLGPDMPEPDAVGEETDDADFEDSEPQPG
jgi:hypothetical protein